MASAPAPQPATVLLAEAAEVRDFLRGMLERYGYEILEAELTEACQVLRTASKRIDLVITNRPQLLEESGSEIPPLLYIAACPDMQWVNGTTLKHLAILSKPFTHRQLIAALEHLRCEERKPAASSVAPASTAVNCA